MGNSQLFSLSPSGTDNWVHFVGDKYEPNSGFSLDVQFHLLNGPRQVTLLGIEGRYFAVGCSSLAREPRLLINGESTEFTDDFDTLRRPRAIAIEETAHIAYARLFWPPLTAMSAADCDFGDLEIRLRFRVGQELGEMTTVFELRHGGRMQTVARVRDVPAVNDACLTELHNRGLLEKHQYEALMGYPPEDRYRVVRSNNTSEDYLGILDVHRKLLRTIVRGGLTDQH